MLSILQDFRLAIRQLRKSKGFTLTAVLTVALALGANTAIFTLVHAVMLKSLPVADPARLYRLGDGDNCCIIGGTQTRFSIYSYPLYVYVRDHTPEFQQMAAFQAGSQRVGVHRGGTSSPAEPFVDQFVSGNYFTMFGIVPYAGRLLAPADDERGAPPVAVMSYRAWEQHYGSDASVVGSTFIIDGAAFTIAGIAPPGFFGDRLRPDPPDFWVPLHSEPEVNRANALLDHKNDYWLYIIGRLQPHAAVAGLESKVNLEVRQWQLENDPPMSARAKTEFERQHVTITPAGGGVAVMREDYAADLKLLFIVTGMVLLIACANLANLLLARGAANRAQASIRVALGAPRWRLIRQTLAESVTLALLGGATGLALAVAGTDALIRLVFVGATFVPINATPSLPVLGFSFLLSLVTGVIFGVAPAWSAAGADPAVALHGTGRSAVSRTTLTQRLLVAAQVALSLVLLTGAALMVQTLGNMRNQSFGFQMQGRVIVNVNAAFSSYAPEKLTAIYREIDRSLSQIPGVRSVSTSLYSPMEGNNWQWGISFTDRPADPNHPLSPSWNRVSPRFFETIGARMLRGRMFDERDASEAVHVAVVNQAFADRFLPNADALGKRFRPNAAPDTVYQIVGVVENVRFRNPGQPAPPMYFLPMLQMSPNEWKNSGLARSNLIGNIELRMAGGVAASAGQVQRALSAIDPNLTMVNVTSLEEQLGQMLSHERLIARLMELFGLLALALALVGLYGVTAHAVAGRTAEIGLRMALGATRASVVGMILGSVAVQIGCGVAIGLPAALGAGRLLAGQLYGIRSYDPATLGLVSLCLAGAAIVAGFLPAFRASGIDPVRALRAE